MAAEESRRAPLIDVDIDEIRTLCAPALGGREIRAVEPLAGGLINTVYRIVPADPGPSLVLRIFTGEPCACQKELDILARVRGALPVPEVRMSDCTRSRFSRPFLVSRWIEGITLNECRKQASSAAFLTLAEPLGALLAGVAGFSFKQAGAFEPGLGVTARARSSLSLLLSATEARLRRGRARERLGAALAEALWQRLDGRASVLAGLDEAASLVHGDMGGRNILVARRGEGGEEGWYVSGLIDWEAAFSGSGLWDVGSLFRYRRRYSEAFCEGFERGYRGAGGELPPDWVRVCRLLDATRQIETLDGERELPVVFGECRELLVEVLEDRCPG